MSRFRCQKCCDTGLVSNPLAVVLCLAAAALYATGVYFAFRSAIEEGGFRLPRMPVIVFCAIVFGPPIGLIWLATSSVFKRACPECTQ